MPDLPMVRKFGKDILSKRAVGVKSRDRKCSVDEWGSSNHVEESVL